MLWLNRPYASMETELRVVNAAGRTVALVSVQTSGDEVTVEVKREDDGPLVRFVKAKL